MWMNAQEKKEFERRQRRQAEQYRRAGMSPEQIRAMAEYDLEADRSLLQDYPEALTVELEELLDPDWTEELGDRLAAKVGRLTPAQRELLELLVFADRKQGEAARMLGVSRQAVNSMWRRTVKKLR